ncbi:MAG: carbon-nitrogen hydrolase family protein [Amphiplicatus sp.]
MQLEGRPFLAACVQMRSGIDRKRNVDDARALIADAAEKGASFVVTPEMTNVLDRDAKRLFAHLPEESALDEVEAFAAMARDFGVWLLVGSMAVKVGERRAANRSYLYSPHGEIAARYDKLHMFDVDLPNGESWKESNVYRPGEGAALVDTPLAKFGLTICYDVRFPHLYRALAQAGAEVLCVPAAFTKQTGEAHWKTLLTARAIENGAFVLAAAQGGVHEDGRATYGHSLAISPWGEILGEAENAEPGVVLAEIDLGRAHEARARIPNLGLERAIKVLTIKA